MDLMEVKEFETRTQEVITDVLCNQCGESLMRWSGGNENGIRALMTSAYDSPILPDDNLMLTFALCEPCVMDMAKGFKLPMYDHNSEGTWMPHAQWARADGQVHEDE